MGQLLHGSARPPSRPRGDIAIASAGHGVAERFSLNEKIVRNWRKRTSLEGCADGTKGDPFVYAHPRKESGLRGLRRPTLLPLDDCLYALQAPIPHLSRYSGLGPAPSTGLRAPQNR